MDKSSGLPNLVFYRFNKSKINGFEPSSGFAVKAYMKAKPIPFLSIGYVLSIIIFGVAIRNFEKFVLDNPSPVKFQFLFNTFWCMVLVMTTVGYGDIYPVTHQGRLTTVFACIWGTFVVSMLIVSLTSLISLENEEEEAYNEMIKKINNKNSLTKDAGDFIREAFIARIVQKKNVNLKERMNAYRELAQTKKRFVFMMKVIHDSNPDIIDEIKKLSNQINEYIVDTELRVKVIKEGVTKQLSIVRKNQTKIDIRMMHLYDNTLRVHAFLKHCNGAMVYNETNLNHIKTLFGKNGQKNSNKPVKEFLQDFFEAREPIARFYLELDSHYKIAKRSRERDDRLKKQAQAKNPENNNALL